MARALIIGCGCRGRGLGRRLLDEGWAVRGTSRSKEGLAPIAEAGIEAAPADPAWPGTVLELVADVTVVHWLLGSATGQREALAAIHGDRLERILERLVDTPVRGFVYESAGSVPTELRQRGESLVRAAGERWRIPVLVVDRDPGEARAWGNAMLEATVTIGTGASNRYD